jgi:hypothetical protein
MIKRVLRTLVGAIFTLLSIGTIAEEITVSRVSAAALLKLKSSVIFNLDKDEKIDPKKSLTWRINATEYYYLPVAYKLNQGCRFVFIDATQRKVVSDGAFSFEKCSFNKTPELLDINKDGQTDFRVWVRLPHTTGSKVLVNHNLDFIFNSRKNMFCESDSDIPCN